MNCAGEQTANTTAQRPTSDDRERFIERRREQKRMERDRLEHGFRHRDIGQIVLGRRRADFGETGLRSDHLGRSGALFVAGCPVGKNLRGGRSKDIMLPVGPSKLLGLDSAYIEGNRRVVSLIRIDLDLVFPTPNHAIAAIRDVVEAGDMPCMPHLICGDMGPARIKMMDDDGNVAEVYHETAFLRPHLWVVLPRGSAVNCGPNGRSEPRRLLAGVARGINSALLHLGADPAASPFLVRGKNPLSPYLWSAALNNQVWPSLSEWSEWVDTRISPEKLSRQAAEVQSGLDKAPSNVAFTAWQRTAYDLLRTAHRNDDPLYLDAVQPSVDPIALADLIRERMPLADLDRDPAWSDVAAERVWNSVVSYAAAAWDPTRAEVVSVARGAMRHVTDGMTRKKAQSAAGKRTGSIKADRALEALLRAYRTIVEGGGQPTQGNVATVAGVTRQTASRRWADVMAGV